MNIVKPNGKPFSFKKVGLNITQRLSDYSTIYEESTQTLTTDLNGRLEFSLFAGENVTNINILVIIVIEIIFKNF